MTINEKFAPIRTSIYDLAIKFFEKIAGHYGYPENPGMPTVYEMSNKSYERLQFFNKLPKHQTDWPPFDRPETLLEMVFGTIPKVETVTRHIYDNKDEGFYNFYIPNYNNLYFLPDWASEFIQVHLNICLDISVLEIIREMLFLLLVFYSQVIVLRITIGWLIFINPYTFPYAYILAAVDWTEDALQGFIPSILGVSVTSNIFLLTLGTIADCLNNLVFTMPFLPSEAEEAEYVVNGKLTDVLVFHYLPILWYKHPIPNELREFWYYQRLDILKHMKTTYDALNIKWLPDYIDEIDLSDYSKLELKPQDLIIQEDLIVNLSNDFPTLDLKDLIDNLSNDFPIEILSTGITFH